MKFTWKRKERRLPYRTTINISVVASLTVNESPFSSFVGSLDSFLSFITEVKDLGASTGSLRTDVFLDSVAGRVTKDKSVLTVYVSVWSEDKRFFREVLCFVKRS